jgi:hypothetical protein
MKSSIVYYPPSLKVFKFRLGYPFDPVLVEQYIRSNLLKGKIALCIEFLVRHLAHLKHLPGVLLVLKENPLFLAHSNNFVFKLLGFLGHVVGVRIVQSKS